MRLPPVRSDSTGVPKTRSVFLVFIGVAGLLLKGSYVGPHMEFVQSYIGNVSVSFSVYFVCLNVAGHYRYGKILSAGLALAIVDLFEALDGFKIMMNVYDPYDYLANAVGIAAAVVVDVLIDYRQRAHAESRHGHHSSGE